MAFCPVTFCPGAFCPDPEGNIWKISRSNAECFYEQFYSQLLTSPMYFPEFEYQLSVELLRKSADKILAHFFRNSNSSPEYLVSAVRINI